MKQENSTFLNKLVGFILPPLGYIFYCIKKPTDKKQSESYGWGALFGTIFYILLVIVIILFVIEEKVPVE